MLEENAILQSSAVIAAADIIPVSAPKKYFNSHPIVQTVLMALLQPTLHPLHQMQDNQTQDHPKSTGLPLTQLLLALQTQRLPPLHSMCVSVNRCFYKQRRPKYVTH